MSKKFIFQTFLIISIILTFFLLACTNDHKIRKSALFYFEEGNYSLKQRDYHMAIWNYQKAINLDSDSPNFHYNLGLVFFEIGNYSESIESFKKVENLVPNQSDTFYNLALAHYKMSNSRMADIYYNRYQDMLSLRKAQERLEEVKNQQNSELRNNETDPKQKVSNKKTTIKKKESDKYKSKLKIPDWEK